MLWSSEAFHELALMCSPRVPAADVDAVRRAFIGMAADAKGRAVLESASKAVALAKASGFVRASDSDYDNYRRFYASAPAQLR